MTIKDEDLKLWQEFTNKLEEAKEYKYTKLSEVGNKVLKRIKENIKSNECPLNNQNCCIQNNNFIIEKGKTLGIDKLSNKKLSNGKYKIDYTLDLHGCTLESAYNRIKNLFKLTENNNYKCLLIITGKGLHSANKTIKNSLSDWFKEPYFSNKIIKYIDASLNHGGSGAVYVLLKDKR